MLKIYGINEIAEALAERRQTVAQWYSRGKLPVPTEVLAMGPAWLADTIDPWIQRRMIAEMKWKYEETPSWDGTGTIAESWSASAGRLECRIDHFKAEDGGGWAYTVTYSDENTIYHLPQGENMPANSREDAEEKILRLIAPAALTPWQTLVLRDGDGDEIQGERRVAALQEFRRSGSIHGIFFDRIGAPHEAEDDASTWGPESPRHVDWTGFPG